MSYIESAFQCNVTESVYLAYGTELLAMLYWLKRLCVMYYLNSNIHERPFHQPLLKNLSHAHSFNVIGVAGLTTSRRRSMVEPITIVGSTAAIASSPCTGFVSLNDYRNILVTCVLRDIRLEC